MVLRIPSLLLSPLLLFAAICSGRAQVEVYFNHSVDTTLAWPVGNVARGNVDFTAIVSGEIGRARQSVEVAMYSLNAPPVVEALVAAHLRGVRVRVIAHVGNAGTAGNRFRELADAGIPVFSNPEAADSQLQPLMHNKFLAIDAGAGVPDLSGTLRPVAITGSWNATTAQSTVDYNNLVVIHDSAVAAAYRAEFEEMWGGPGRLPDSVHARFGPDKLATTDTLFTLADGTRLRLHFSPSDHTSRAINTALASARHSIYTATLAFTYRQFAATLRREHVDSGVDVRSIIDQTGTGTQYDTLRSFADALLWNRSGMFHHKYAVIDALPFGGDGESRVVTGSHNWSVAAELRNDENTVVIENAAIANQYLQEFAARYRDAGGTAPFITTVGTAPEPLSALQFRVVPDPFDGSLLLMVEGAETGADLRLYGSTGVEIARFDLPAGSSVQRIAWRAPSGLYIARLICGSERRTATIFAGR